MKRRVLRAHANKRCLRLLSAEHGLRLDTYNILCDASFLRAVALAEGHNDRPMSQVLKVLMHDTFAAATSHVVQEVGSELSGESQKKFKELSLFLFYLPETATTLRRLVQKRQAEQDISVSSPKENARGGKRKSTLNGGSEKGSFSAIVESLLSGLECTGRENLAAHKNEAKAIAQFVSAAASGQGSQHAMQERKNAHCFFVATQSHDVRRLLPGNAGLIRLTTSPTALWIEKNADAFHYVKTDIKKMPKHGASAAMRGKGLSAEDVAFMRHLSGDLLSGRSANKRLRVVSPGVATGTTSVVASVTCEQMTTGSKPSSGIEGKKKIRDRRKGARKPNPLAVKKKRVREVLRVDSGTRKKGH